jgi:23S rRNA pseudouridine2605 synthase
METIKKPSRRRPGPDTAPPAPAAKPERIAKLLAHAGVASRRDVERMIADGRVALNGVLLSTPATVLSSLDGITVDGHPIAKTQGLRVWRYYKPTGCLTTHRDPQGRPTVFELLPPELPRVVSVGRLDMNTEGLLLLTNDGELARFLELPANAQERRYRVRVHGSVSQMQLEDLASGITLDGIHYGPIIADLEQSRGRNSWLAISLREGKNREVRRICEHLGLLVARLIRVGFGPFELGDLEPTELSELPARVLRRLLPPAFADRLPPEIDDDRPRRNPRSHDASGRPPGPRRGHAHHRR